MGNNPSKYVKDAVNYVKTNLKNACGDKFRVPNKAENPFRMGYEPELDDSPLLESRLTSYDQSLI
eukprot:6932932-Ditylum_brightwellii.AAC.1